MKSAAKSYLNWVPGPVLGYGPPAAINHQLPNRSQLIPDPAAIRAAQKEDRRRHTVRVKSLLP